MPALVSAPDPARPLKQAPNIVFEASKALGDNTTQTEKPKSGALDYLAKFGLIGLIVLNITLLGSKRLANIAKKLVESNYISKQSRPTIHSLLKKYSDPEKAMETLKRAIHLMALIQLSSNFQISINTEQPNKFLASALYGLRSVFMVIQPNKWSESLNFAGSTFWFAGERNDIENSNHPGQRRGLDIRTLLYTDRQGKTRINRQELTHARHFIADDMKYALSAKPWQELVKNIKHPTGLNVPKSYQTALGSQFNLFAWLGLFGTLILSRKPGANTSRLFKALKAFSQFSAAASIIIPSIPLASRAWQSRSESDGLMTLLGIPIATASRVALAAPTLNTISGIGGIGQPLIQEGKRVNSKKYQMLVKYLRALYDQAQRNPSLTASNVLRQLQESPDTLKVLQGAMGKVRVNYLMDILREGVKQPQIPFAAYLYPLTLQSEESQAHAS